MATGNRLASWWRNVPAPAACRLVAELIGRRELPMDLGQVVFAQRPVIRLWDMLPVARGELVGQVQPVVVIAMP